MRNEKLAKDKGSNVGNEDVIDRCKLENCEILLIKDLRRVAEMHTCLFAELLNGFVKCTFPTRGCHRKQRSSNFYYHCGTDTVVKQSTMESGHCSTRKS